jgi:hypothetical protein
MNALDNSQKSSTIASEIVKFLKAMYKVDNGGAEKITIRWLL